MDTEFFEELSLSAQEQTVLQEEILAGKYGKPGEAFLTTRALAEKRHVSLVTAHNILLGLRSAGYIVLKGKRYFLSYEDIEQQKKSLDNTIALLVPQLNNEFYSSLSEAVVDIAGKNGFHVLIMSTSYKGSEEKQALQALINYKVAGIINCVPTDTGIAEIYRSCPVPCVMLAHSLDKCRISSVQVNSFSISRKVAQYLVEEGYRKFLYIGNKTLSSENDVRFTAFRMELTQQGFTLGDDDIIRISTDSNHDEEFLFQRLESISEPVGIFCYHDLLAVSVYRICGKLGRSIPDDVGVVGFDDLSIASLLSPSLTTVQYRLTTMADMAIKLLLARIKSPSAPYDNYYIEPNLIVRKSAAFLSKKFDEVKVC